MQTLLIILAVVIIAMLLYLASLDGRYLVRRSKRINADIQTVFDKLRDFTGWADWSPWLMHEPDTRLEFSDNPNDVGGHYTWDGQYIGAGKLTHVAFAAPNRIEQQIEFFRPFKSVCKVNFALQEQDGQTEVTWEMHGKMPFFFRFMTKQLVQMINHDYDLGLAMLAGRLDPNAEYPRLSFVGVAEVESQLSVCKSFAGGLQDMQAAMEAGFPKLIAHVEQQNGQMAGMPFTAYHKVNIKKMHFVCDMAVPIQNTIDAREYALKTLGGGRYFKVTLQGSYDFLELAWYAAMSHIRMKKLKFDPKRPSMEVYENDPNTVANSNEILTSIYVPIK